MLGRLAALLALVIAISSGQPCGRYQNTVMLDPSIGYSVSWNITGPKIQLALQATQTGGWLGLGLADHGGGTMKGADVLACAVNGGQVTCSDYHVPWSPFSTAQGVPDFSFISPIADSSNDWKIISTQQSQGQLIFELERLLNTTDLQDRVFIPNGNNMIWAHGSGASLSYHGANRGLKFINFFNNTVIPIPPYDGVTTIATSQYAIPGQRTTYMCQGFMLPTDKQRHVIAFEPVLDNAPLVHHMVLYVCGNNTVWQRFAKGPDECFTGDTPMDCQAVMYVFAHVAVPYVLPPVAGFPIGPDQTGDSFVVLEYHYDNPTLATNFVDSSGVKIYWSETLRPNDAGSLTLGSTSFPDLVLSSDGQVAHRQSNCPSMCTQAKLRNNPLTIFASFQHMHNYGYKIQTNRYDSSGKYLGTYNRVDWWDGGFQSFQYQAPPYMQLKAGDALYTHCYYDLKSTGGAPVKFGTATSDEMCLDFLLYYPKLPTFDTCAWLPGNATLCGDIYADPANSTFANLQKTPDPQVSLLYNDPLNFGVSNIGTPGFPSASSLTTTCVNPSATTTASATSNGAVTTKGNSAITTAATNGSAQATSTASTAITTAPGIRLNGSSSLVVNWFLVVLSVFVLPTMLFV